MKHIIEIILALFLITGCADNGLYVHFALKSAGKNSNELKSVLRHYRTVDRDHEKLLAARYLIANMPAHYSYRDTSAINSYYRTALGILGTSPSPDWQRDTLRYISDTFYPELTSDIIPDVCVMTANYLISCIDRAFQDWRTRPWSRHLTFKEFRDWILPYKVTELQSFDSWREMLSSYYSDSLSAVPSQDVQRNSIYGAMEIVRNEIHSKQSDIGMRVIWENRSGIPMLSAPTWIRMTYGSCMDYVTMGTAVFRSLGLPAAVDQVPVWGRNNDGHSWYVFLSDRGKEERTINSLIMPAGMQFYPYERIPKVWRKTYSINRERVRYRNNAKYVYPFDLCQQDVTDHYNLTSDLKIDIDRSVRLKDKYVYIAMAVNAGGPEWRVLDFGKIRHGKACFSKIGRNVMYIVLGFDGKGLVPVSAPFILQKNGGIDYICGETDRNGTPQSVSIDLRRKYLESFNVVDMRRRIVGGRIECSDNENFDNALTVYTIQGTDIPSRIDVFTERPYRYWRYYSPDGSWGSISELSFFDSIGTRLQGKGIANPEAGQDAIERAYDNNLLSNFEINQPNDNWVGMDMGVPVLVRQVSVSPRSDDNDICPGNEYELFCFDGKQWNSLGYRIAKDNSLHYDNIPVNTLLWLRNYTRGNNERPFLINYNNEIEWW